MSDELKGLDFGDILKYLALAQKYAPEVVSLVQRLLAEFSKPKLVGASADGHCCVDEAIKAQLESLSHLLHLKHEHVAPCEGGECDGEDSDKE